MPKKETNFAGAVGARLVRLQEILGLTQAALAELMEMSPQALANAQSGSNAPKPWKLRRLHDEHGITSDFVYFGDVKGLPQWIAKELAKPVAVVPTTKGRKKVA